jgi:hypothetical protein
MATNQKPVKAMEAPQKPRLSIFDERHDDRPIWSVGRRVRLDSVNPEGVARLNTMVNQVLPRLTKS